MIERQTAKKVRISSLMGGTWVKKEGMEPSFITTEYGEQVSRARVMGTIVGKFVAEDEAFASITLDDGTDTMRAKTFKQVQPLDTVNQGELVDVIGKVREWNGEVYMIPEVVLKVDDPNIELLRRLEIAEKLQAMGAHPAAAPAAAAPDGLREDVLKLISTEPEGISYDALLKKIEKPEPAVEKVINNLLGEGVCYEPTPGKIKKI